MKNNGLIGSLQIGERNLISKNKSRYKITYKNKLIAWLGGGWFIFCAIFLAILGHASIFLILLTLLSVIFGIYLISVASYSYIDLSPQGITYGKPFVSIQINWEDIQLVGDKKNTYITSKGKTVVKAPKLLKLFLPDLGERIPLHPFIIDNPKRDDEEKILKEIAHYAPQVYKLG